MAVIKTDSSICARLSGLEGDGQSSGFSGSLQEYLQQHLGGDYQLSETQLTELEQSCISCHYLLKVSMTLPAALAGTAEPLHCSELPASLDEIAGAD